MSNPDEHTVQITVRLPSEKGRREITFTVGWQSRRLVACTDDLITGRTWKVTQPIESLGKGYAIEFEWIPVDGDLEFFDHRVSFRPIIDIKR